jgi:hypothetical protein
MISKNPKRDKKYRQLMERKGFSQNRRKEIFNINPILEEPEEELGNNGEPIRDYPEDDPREIR